MRVRQVSYEIIPQWQAMMIPKLRGEILSRRVEFFLALHRLALTGEIDLQPECCLSIERLGRRLSSHRFPFSTTAYV